MLMNSRVNSDAAKREAAAYALLDSNTVVVRGTLRT